MDKALSNILKTSHWYVVLGIPESSTKTQIRERFKSLAIVFHPNSVRNKKLTKLDKKKACVKMARINEARIKSGAI